MRDSLRPYCIPVPASRLAHFKSRLHVERNYRKNVFRAHDKLLAARSLMPVEKFDDYFKFAFVRNPWERLVSEYEFLLSRPQHGRHGRVSRLKDFHAFIKMQIPRHDAYQVNMLSDRRGRLLTNFVGKMENLDDDWKKVCDHIEIPHQALPFRKVGQRKPYRDYYDNDSKALVNTHWARDIELFDYGY